MLLCEREFSQLGVSVERIPLSDALKQDPDYSTNRRQAALGTACSAAEEQGISGLSGVKPCS